MGYIVKSDGTKVKKKQSDYEKLTNYMQKYSNNGKNFISYSEPYQNLQTQAQPQKVQKQNNSGLVKKAKGSFLDQFLGTTGDILADVGEGILGFSEGIADTLTYGAADVVGLFNEDLANDWRENAKFNSTEALFGKDKDKNMFGNWRNDLDEYSRSGDFSDMVFKGIGTTAGAVGTAGLGAGAGVWTQTSNAATFIPMFTSSYGNAKSEALNNGADNFNATVSALKSGTIDGFTELMFGALPGLNKGSKLGNTITDAVGKGAEKAFGKTAGRIAVGLTKTMGEGAEEVFGNIFNAQANDILNFITNGSYNYGMENQTGNIFKDTMNVLSDVETWKEFLSASLSAAITQSGTKIFTKAQTNKVIKEYAKDHNIGFNEAKEKLENYSNIFEDITNKKLGYTEALENKEESKAKALNLMKSQYLNNIENQINETTDKAINSLNERIEQAKAELKQIDEEGVLDSNDPEVQKMVLSKYNLNSLDSLSEKEIKQYKDSLREKYVDRLENPDKYTKYQYEEADNERTNKIYQSADKANIDNTKESRDFVDKMVRVANDLKTDVLFTNNEELKANPNIDLEAIAQDLIQEEQTKKGSELTEKEIEEIKNRVLSEIGGYYNSKTGTIYINADNKTEGAKFIFGHELMHRLEQNKVQEELRKAIFEHAKTKGIYDTERSTLEKLYKGVTKDIDSELVANLLGKLYQDESFVKDLAVKKPNIFNQIFSKLKEMYYKATGQQEKAELEKIVRLYQKVYNEVKEEGFENKEGTKLGLFDRFKKEKYEVIDPKNIEKIGYSDGLVKEIQNKTRNNLKDRENIAYISPEKIKDYLETGGAREIGTTEELISKIRNNGITSPIEIVKTEDGYKIKNGNHRLYIALKMGLNEIPIEYNENIANLVDGTKEEVEDTSFSNDIKYSLSKDNQGRELSKQQKEFFKDAKTRNNKGELIELYHGTPNDFTIFNTKNFGGANGTAEGFGIYLTDNIEVADDYLQQDKGKVMKLYANITKPATTDNLTVNKQDIIKAIKELTNKEAQQMVNDGDYDNINDAIKDTWISNYTYTYDKSIENSYNDVAKTILESSENDYEILQELMNGSGNNDYKYANDFYTTITDTLGFDGIKTKWDFSTDSELKKKNADIWIAFYSNQVKNIDNTNPTANEDIRFSLSENTTDQKLQEYLINARETGNNAYLNRFREKIAEQKPDFFNKNTTDMGVKLTNDQQTYFENSKARGINNSLKTVYHTTTDEIPQFNEFNPVGTQYYRFGNQIVNYYTDSKEMSGSYASQDYKMADTKKLNNIEEAKNYLKHISNLTGNILNINKRAKDGLYTVTQDKQISKEAREFIKTLSDTEKQQMLDHIYEDKNEEMEGSHYDRVFSWNEFDKDLQNKYHNLTNKYLGTADIVAIQQEVMRYLEYPVFATVEDTENGQIIGGYKTEEELLKNIKTDLQKSDWSKNSKIQYEGYVNITNPYVVDAEKRNWNQVISQSNDFIDELDERIPQSVKNDLTRLYRESENKSSDLRTEYDLARKYIDEVDRYLETNKETAKIKHLATRLGYDTIDKINSGITENLGVSTYYNLAEVLEQQGVIGKDTAKLIIDDFVIPEQVQNWINKNYNKKLKVKDLGVETNLIRKRYNVDKISIADLFDAEQKAYINFDKYRMPSDYFIEQISSEGNNYLGNELEDMFETRAEIYGADKVGEEIAQAASVGFSKPELIRLWGTSKTTNDIVKEVIASNQDGTTNYDGVIIKNVYDYGGRAEGETEANNLYVTFNSNQFKAADNLHPTDDPDIRYSMGNNPGTITPNDMVVKELYGELPLPIAKQVDLPYADTEKPKEETTEDKRLQNKINKENEKAIKIATKDMELNRQELKQLRQDLEKYKGKTREELTNAETFNDIYDIVSNYANRNYIQTDEELKAVQNEIRKTRIRVPEELKKQITDYNYFRKQNMGRLMLSNSGQSIDSVYEELSNSYPGYFKDATTEADMLYELADFMNKDANTIMEYQLTDTELNNQATKIFNKLVTNTLNENDINEIQEKLSKKKISRKDVRNILLDEMGLTVEDISKGKDINPISYTITDPVRVNEKVYGNEIGNKINNATINVTKHNEAEKTRFLNQEIDEIKDLGIKARSKESAAVQKYGEKYYINEQGEKVPYGDRELASEFKNTKTQEKIKHAAEVIRNKYDKYIDKVNAVLEKMGYNMIPKRNDYMHHFQELTDIFSKWGIPFNPQSMSDDLLPTDINGLTEFNRPGKNWFSAAQQRMGEKTTYDAITGIDQYLRGVSDLIYHTEDIQRYRALEELIRNTYGQEHGLENAESLTEEEFNQRIADIQANKLSGYASWLNEQANTLANKKSTIDRGFEKTFGRKVYSAMNTLKTQVGSNMTGFNVRSALTNFISTTLAASKTNKLAMVKGTVQTINNIFHKDNFIDKSDFLTARFGSDVLSKKGWQKLASAGQIFMSGTDWFTSNVIVRSKYYEGLAKGMTEEQAIKYADDFGFRVMGDRSKGSTANAFNSKTLGLLTQFQLEVNNQWDFMLHDSKRDYNLAEDKSKATAGLLFQMGQLAAYSYLANELFDKFTGSRVTFDPIEIFKKLFGLDDDDKDKSVEERMTEASQLLIDGLPFVSTFTGGRIPLSSALPNMEELITGKDKNGNEKSRLDTLKEPLPYLFMPTGYSQLNKTKGALEMYDSSLPVAGSYTDSGNLRFTTKTDAASTARNLLFGKWSSEEAQDYLDSGYKTIPANKVQEMIDLNMDSTEYRAYRENLTKATKTTNDEGYTKYIDNNNNTYWYDKETGNLYDDNGKLSDKNVMSLNKANKSQATADYINSLPYTKEQKNIMLNNALGKSDTITDQYGYEKYKDSNGNVYWLDSKNDILYDKNYNEINDNRLRSEKFINGLQKVSNEVNISDYNKYGDYEEYQYAISNPERYSAISQITDYKTYQNYADEIESIKSKYQTTDNMTTKQKQYISKQRKQAVFDYINNLNLNKNKKLMLYRLAGGYSINNYKTQMFNYINSLKLSKKEKETIYKELF